LARGLRFPGRRGRRRRRPSPSVRSTISHPCAITPAAR
jgi:hypothetical protein